MSVTKTLSFSILLLVLYNGFMIKFIDEKKTTSKKQEESLKVYRKGLDNWLQDIAGLSFIIIFCYLLATHVRVMTILILIPGTVVYLLVFFSASSTIGSLAISKGNNPLTRDESGSIVFVGIIVGFVGLIRAYGIETKEEISIWGCLALVIEYSLYMFFAGALLMRPIKDIAKFFISQAYRINQVITALSKYVVKKMVPGKKKIVISELILDKRRTVNKWNRYFQQILLLVTIPIDVAEYLIQYFAILLIWFPVACVVVTVMMLGRCILRVMRWIDGLSNRRVAVILCRLVIIVAMLTVIIMNRYDLLITSEATTAILEFISSVVIIPIVFEWLHTSIAK